MVKIGVIIFEHRLRISIGMSLALPFTSSFMIVVISSQVHSDKNILDITGGPMKSVNFGSACIGIPSSQVLSFTAIDVKKLLKPFAICRRSSTSFPSIRKDGLIFDFSWINTNGSRTTIKPRTLEENAHNFLTDRKKIDSLRKSTLAIYNRALNHIYPLLINKE